MFRAHWLTFSGTLASCFVLACGDVAKWNPENEELGGGDTQTRMGLKGRSGTLNDGGATISGTEEAYLEDSTNTDVCRVRYDLTETTRRQDCDDCVWAVELEITNAQILSTSTEGCHIFGITEGDASVLNETALIYGYNEDYFGHAQALHVYSAADGWQVLGLGSYDENSKSFTYDAHEGEHAY